MMKRVLAVFLLTVSVPIWGGLADDGFLTEGEYVGSVTWRSFEPPLIVDGGGAYQISVRDYGRLVVQSTSTPLSDGWPDPPGGVYDILLFNNSQLLYLNGVTEFIWLTQNNSAELKGGIINYIKATRYAAAELGDENVFIYAYEDSWSWIDNDPLKGIQGIWLANDLPFRIEFINDFDYSPTWMSVQVIPEPTTFVLLGLGGLLLRRQKR
jgi:hypothetical protein